MEVQAASVALLAENQQDIIGLPARGDSQKGYHPVAFLGMKRWGRAGNALG